MSSTNESKTIKTQGVQEGLPQALNAALELAERGIASFPCLATKAPACTNGFKAATTEPDALRRLWSACNAPLVGVPTGTLNGFDVLDIDPRHGGDVWLRANEGKLPVTQIHQTRSGGMHIFFQHKEGVRNSAGKIATGVDVRGDGGYIIWWPAAEMPVPSDTPPASWPDWMIEILLPTSKSTKKSPAKNSPRKHNAAYEHVALRRAATIVMKAEIGQRNDTLNREIYGVLSLVQAGALDADEAAIVMARAALAVGLDRNEIVKTVASAIRARRIA